MPEITSGMYTLCANEGEADAEPRPRSDVVASGPSDARPRPRRRRPGRRRTWLLSPDGFRELRHSCFLSRKACAEFLGVSERTVRHWDAGRCRVPWSAVRLLRFLRLGDLGALHDSWTGWVINRNGLWSPDGKHYSEASMRRWWLTCEQARFWRHDYDRRASGGVGAEAPADTLRPEAGEAGNLPMVAPSPPVEATTQMTALFVVPLAAVPMSAEHLASAVVLPSLPNAGVFAADPAMLAAKFPALMQGQPLPIDSNLLSQCHQIAEFVADQSPATRLCVSGPDSNTGLNLGPALGEN